MLANDKAFFMRRFFFASMCMFTFSTYPITCNQSAIILSSAVHFTIGAASLYHAYDAYNNVSNKLTKVPDVVKKFSSTVHDITQTNTSFFYKLCSLGTVSLIAGIINLYFAFSSSPKKVPPKNLEPLEEKA